HLAGLTGVLRLRSPGEKQVYRGRGLFRLRTGYLKGGRRIPGGEEGAIVRAVDLLARVRLGGFVRGGFGGRQRVTHVLRQPAILCGRVLHDVVLVSEEIGEEIVHRGVRRRGRRRHRGQGGEEAEQQGEDGKFHGWDWAG